jgi:hypothetical protein
VNHLLEALPPKARSVFLKGCDQVPLELGTVVCEAGRPYRHAYFPLRGFVSLVAMVGRHPPLEIALIGDEGMLGSTLALGVRRARLQGIVQGAGTALRMPALQFQRALRESALLHDVVGRYLYVVLAQLSRAAVCARFHEAEARLARCLLVTHDRAHAGRIDHTHQYLADILGVRRSAVTIAAGTLQRRELIRYARGKIEVIDRKGLEAASCECYEAAHGDYQRMLD